MVRSCFAVVFHVRPISFDVMSKNEQYGPPTSCTQLRSIAHTVPPFGSSATISPARLSSSQVLPPSCVVKRLGLKAHPSFELAKRSSCTRREPVPVSHLPTSTWG